MYAGGVWLNAPTWLVEGLLVAIVVASPFSWMAEDRRTARKKNAEAAPTGRAASIGHG